MEQIFRDQLSEAKGLGIVSLWWRMLVDLIKAATYERSEEHLSTALESNASAKAGFVLGLTGIILVIVPGLAWFGFWMLGLLPGIPAVVLGLRGRARAGRGAPFGRWATAGVTMGLVTLSLALVAAGLFFGPRG